MEQYSGCASMQCQKKKKKKKKKSLIVRSIITQRKQVLACFFFFFHGVFLSGIPPKSNLQGSPYVCELHSHLNTEEASYFKAQAKDLKIKKKH